jgi:hypothetical protein
MSERNFSMVEYFNRRAEERRPELSFKGKTKADWKRWQKLFRTRMMELCGEWPKPVPLNPEIIYSMDEGDFIRQKVVIDTEKHFSVPTYVLIPKDKKRAKKGKLPAILCLHGHGPFGKEPVAGVKDPNRQELTSVTQQHNYNYAEQMTLQGYLTISPDSRGFGELDDGGDPYPGKDKWL